MLVCFCFLFTQFSVHKYLLLHHTYTLVKSFRIPCRLIVLFSPSYILPLCPIIIDLFSSQWQSEVAIWAPEMNSLVYHGSSEAKEIIQQVRLLIQFMSSMFILMILVWCTIYF